MVNIKVMKIVKGVSTQCACYGGNNGEISSYGREAMQITTKLTINVILSFSIFFIGTQFEGHGAERIDGRTNRRTRAIIYTGIPQ
jgi:hypothetical protein